MKKRFIKGFIAAAAAAALGTAAYAKDITVTVDGIPLTSDQPPVIENDRTLVPMRAIFEALGAEVTWDDDTKTVTSVKGEISVRLTIGGKNMLVGEESVELDVPAKIINDRTMVPARAVSEAMSCKVDWDGEEQRVIITLPTAAPTAVPESTDAPEGTAVPEGTTAPEGTAAPEAESTAAPSVTPVPAAIEDGVNIFTTEGIAAGTLLDGTKGTESENKDVCSTDFIAVNAGKSYFASYYHPNECAYKANICVNYAFYDAERKYISGANTDMTKPVKAPENAQYLRFSIKLAADSRAIRYVTLMQTDSAPKEFKKSAYFASEARTDAFEGKKIYLIGDAQVSNGGAWLKEVDKALNPNVLQTKTNNYYRYTADAGNASLTATSVLNGFVNDADYVVVFSGLYDWQTSVSMGNDSLRSNGIYDFAQNSKTKWKNSKMIFITMPLYKNAAEAFSSGGLYNARGMTSAEYSETIKLAAEENGAYVIDLSELWTKENMTEYLKQSNLNYLYPNEAGAELIAEKIIEGMTEAAK